MNTRDDENASHLAQIQALQTQVCICKHSCGQLHTSSRVFSSSRQQRLLAGKRLCSCEKKSKQFACLILRFLYFQCVLDSCWLTEYSCA
jgi:hypothetical protein